jgi:glutaredoxin-like protein NrdH
LSDPERERRREEMKEITVYTLPSCVQCDSTKRFLNKNLIEYKEINLSQDNNSMDFVRSLGYTAAPIVVSGEDSWSGFRMDKLNEIIK